LGAFVVLIGEIILAIIGIIIFLISFIILIVSVVVRKGKKLRLAGKILSCIGIIVGIIFTMPAIFMGGMVFRSFNYDASLVTAIEVEIDTRNMSAIRSLLEEGQNPNVEQTTISGDRRCLPLILACENGDYKVAELLVKYGADVNKTDSQTGMSPLMSIHKWPNTLEITKDITKLLLDNGADIHAKNNKGQTALECACLIGNCQVIETLINYGDDINQKTTDGATPLLIMCNTVYTEYTNIVKLMVEHGANVNATDTNKLTPLMRICDFEGYYNNEKFEVIKFLLDNGSNVNATSKDGRSAMEHFKESYKNLKKSNFNGVIDFTYDDALNEIKNIEQLLNNLSK
jgi:ankyrin repeat protein